MDINYCRALKYEWLLEHMAFSKPITITNEVCKISIAARNDNITVNVFFNKSHRVTIGLHNLFLYVTVHHTDKTKEIK